MPLALRDWLYDWVARYRLRLFGTRQSCYVASPQSRSRFLV